MADTRRHFISSRLLSGLVSVLPDASADQVEPAGPEAQLAALHAALEHIPSAAFMCDGAGRVAVANAAARRRLEADEAFAQRALDSGDAQVSALPGSGSLRQFLVVTRRPGAVETAVEHAASAWGLTAREVEVLVELAGGRSNGQIAGGFGLARRTVELHVTSLLRKAGVATRAQLIIALWQLSESA